VTLIDALALLNDRSRPLEERRAAVEWLAQIRGVYTEQEYVAELREVQRSGPRVSAAPGPLGLAAARS
jgi:hypothetical protein